MRKAASGTAKIFASCRKSGPYHYISSKNRQQISTSPQPYQKIPVFFITCTTSLSVNQILSVDLITVIFIFHYFLFFIVTSYCILFLHSLYCIILCYLALWPQEWNKGLLYCTVPFFKFLLTSMTGCGHWSLLLNRLIYKLLFTQRRSVAKSVGCCQQRLFVCLFVSTITSKRVNIEWWNLGWVHYTKISAEFEYGGHSPWVRILKNVALGYDVRKILFLEIL